MYQVNQAYIYTYTLRLIGGWGSGPGLEISGGTVPTLSMEGFKVCLPVPSTVSCCSDKIFIYLLAFQWSLFGRYIHSSFPEKSIGIASGMVDSGRSIMDRVSPPRPHNYLLSLFISCVVIVTNSFVVQITYYYSIQSVPYQGPMPLHTNQKSNITAALHNQVYLMLRFDCGIYLHPSMQQVSRELYQQQSSSTRRSLKACISHLLHKEDRSPLKKAQISMHMLATYNIYVHSKYTITYIPTCVVCPK